MRLRVSFAHVSVIALITLDACAVLVPAPTPTEIPAPTPTVTPTPTETPTPDPKSLISDGLSRTLRSSSLRLDMQLSIGDPIASANLLAQGERSRNNSHLVYTSTIGTFQDSAEALLVEGRTYIHGPSRLAGAPENKWYRLPPGVRAPLPFDSTNPAPSPGSAADPLKFYTNDLEAAVRLRAETLDGLTCDVYVRGKDSVLNGLSDFADVTLSLSESQKADIQVAEVKYWICSDGYAHQVHFNLVSQHGQDTARALFVIVKYHWTDFNQPIVLTAPTDASDLPTPAPTPTRTPAPTRTSTPTRTPTVAPTPTPGPPALNAAGAQALLSTALKWNLVQYADFTNVNGWPLDDTTSYYGKATATLGDGKYRWSAGPVNQTVVYWEASNKAGAYADGYIAINARRVSGPINLDYGLIFRTSLPYNTYYLFNISDTGTFEVSTRGPGFLVSLIPTTATTAIRPGSVNRLAVVLQGTLMTFYINGQYVGRALDDYLARGLLGVAFRLAKGESAEIEFSDLELRVP